MDADRFDALLRSLSTTPSRRSAVRLLTGWALAGALTRLSHEEGEAGRKNKRKKKRKKRGERCGARTCGRGQFCCDDVNGTCCTTGSECCSPGSGSGSCCDAPHRCARTYGDDASSPICRPPDRIWQAAFGHVRCCPPGSHALVGVDGSVGPCCPDQFVCRALNGTPHCCNDPSAPQCCQGTCCAKDVTCCGGTCCDEERCASCVDGECREGCRSPLTCVGGRCQCAGGGARCGSHCCSAGETCCNEETGLCCPDAQQECCNGKCWNLRDAPHTPCGDSCCQFGRTCCGTPTGLSCKDAC